MMIIHNFKVCGIRTADVRIILKLVLCLCI